MNELIKNIPWDKLGEVTIVTLVSIFVIYFIFKKYISQTIRYAKLNSNNGKDAVLELKF